MSPKEIRPISKNMLFFMAFLMVIVWGSAFTLVSIGVKYISPLWLVTYRLIIGAILIIIYVKFKGLNLPSIKDKRWIWYFAMGLIGMVIPFFLLSTGQVIIDSGLTAIMVGTMPLMTVILAHFFTNEKLSITKIIEPARRSFKFLPISATNHISNLWHRSKRVNFVINFSRF